MTSPRSNYLETLIITASHLVADRAAVRAVTVVTGRRLTYGEVADLRALAETSGVRLTMDGAGDLTLRRIGRRPAPLGGRAATGKPGPMGAFTREVIPGATRSARRG